MLVRQIFCYREYFSYGEDFFFILPIKLPRNAAMMDGSFESNAFENSREFLLIKVIKRERANVMPINISADANAFCPHLLQRKNAPKNDDIADDVILITNISESGSSLLTR